MSSSTPAKSSSGGSIGGLSPKNWLAIILTLLAVLIIAVNWDQTQISFLFFKATMPLAVALAIAFLGGMAAGALMFRRRQKH